MTKTSAVRSIMRREALYKQAGLVERIRGANAYHRIAEPGTLVPLLGLVGGTHQIVKALEPDPEVGRTERVVRGLAGAGLTAGGMYVLGDDRVRNAIRRAVYGLLGRSAK